MATAFMNVGGPGDARLAIVIEGHADRCWDEAFPAGPGRPWHTGTATFRTRAGAKSPRDVRRQVLHREVAERLLDNDVRHHVVLNAQEAPELMLPDGCVLVLGALEVLHIGTQSVPGTAFMVVVHARAASLPQRALHDLFQSRYRENLLAVVEDLLGAHTTHDVGFRLQYNAMSDRTVPLFTAVWVPYRDAVAAVEGASARLPLGQEVLAGMRPLPAGARLGVHECVVVGWQMAWLPTPISTELGEEKLAEVRGATHLLSQSWSVTMNENVVAYVQRQEDAWGPRGRLAMVTTHLDIYLLVLLGRARVKELSSRLGQAAAELRSLVGSTSEGVASARHRPHADVGDADQVARGRGAGPAPGAQAVPTLDAAIDKAITLDSEAVVFLAGEWWTDVTDAPLGDRLLRWMQATGGLERSVQQVVEQVHQLRESVQNLLGRQEQRIELERQRSSRVMEKALAVLAFVGVPLSVVLELWVNWDPSHGLGERGWPAWLLLAGMILASIGVGLALTVLIGGRSWSDHRSRLDRGSRSDRGSAGS